MRRHLCDVAALHIFTFIHSQKITLHTNQAKLSKMKKTIFTLLLVCSTMVYAQVTLEKTFNGAIGFFGMSVSDIDLGLEPFYVMIQSDSNKIELYNASDYSLYKSVPANFDLKHRTSSISAVSRKLFDIDDQVEFLLHLSWSDGIYTKKTTYLLNEDGDIEMTFAEGGSFSFHRVNGQNRMAISTGSFGNYITKIYSLPGTISTEVEQSCQPSLLSMPYPNPANTTIHLPYQLQQGTTATLQVFNPQGQLVVEKQVGSMFDEVLLDVSSYTPGTYIYTVNGQNGRFVVK